MKNIIHIRAIVIGIAAFLYTSPLAAQVSQARFDSLAAVVAKMERWFGPYGDSIPPASGFAARCPELPNGRYSVWCRVAQIGNGIDGNNVAVAGIASRLAVVEQKPAGAPVMAGTIRADKLILGSCLKTDPAAHLWICGDSDANIYVESNGSGGQHQNQSRHYGMWSLAADGGMRLLQNQYVSTECVPATDTNANPPVQYMDCLKTFIDPNREVGLFGPDSRAQFSWMVHKPGRTHERTQDLVLRTYEDSKTLTLESWRPGWKIEFATSSGLISIDKWFSLQQKQE